MAERAVSVMLMVTVPAYNTMTKVSENLAKTALHSRDSVFPVEVWKTPDSLFLSPDKVWKTPSGNIILHKETKVSTTSRDAHVILAELEKINENFSPHAFKYIIASNNIEKIIGELEDPDISFKKQTVIEFAPSVKPTNNPEDSECKIEVATFGGFYSDDGILIKLEENVVSEKSDSGYLSFTNIYTNKEIYGIEITQDRAVTLRRMLKNLIKWRTEPIEKMPSREETAINNLIASLFKEGMG